MKKSPHLDIDSLLAGVPEAEFLEFATSISGVIPRCRRLATYAKEYYLVTYPNRPALWEELEKVRW